MVGPVNLVILLILVNLLFPVILVNLVILLILVNLLIPAILVSLVIMVNLLIQTFHL